MADAQVAEREPEERPARVRGDVNAYVVVAALILVAAVATWFVPAGAYNRVLNAETGRQVVEQGSFHSVDASPVGPWEVFLLIQKGLIDAAEIVFFILIVGGCFGLVTKTGAMTSLIAKFVTRFRGKRYESWSFIAIFALLYTFAMTFGFAEQGIIFVPFIVIMAISLGYDAIVAVAVVVFATALGYAGSLTGPFNVAIAQKIADLPLYSGLWFRAIASAVIFSIAAAYLLRYARKVKKDPSKSLVAHLDFSDLEITDDPTTLVMTNRHKRVLVVFGLSLAFMIFAMLRLDFSLAHLTAYFLLVAIAMGVVATMRPGAIADNFVDGAKALVYPALLVGVARGIQVILESGAILDSLINGLVQPLSSIPTLLVPGAMVLVQSLINLIIPSSSAMAVITMPIMSPLSDLLDVQRQTAVLAFQFGDGITNLILPTYSVLVGALGLARVPFGAWFRFAWPLAIILTLTVIGLAILAQQIGVGPF